MLVVDDSGRVAPLGQDFWRQWIPHGGKTMPLNQRFARMWRIPHKILDRLAADGDLRDAFDRQDFTAFFQPQADVNTNQIVAMEALLRWQHPHRGLLSPDDFLPMAEQTGLIVQLGEWILGRACRQNKLWHEAGLPPLRMAINLSIHQLREPNLVSLVARVLKQTGLDPDLVELEITEQTAMQNAASDIKVLQELRELGVRIVLDDFGTGFSSLSYLKELPLQALKIDRSFVAGITSRPKDAAIVTTIIVLGHSLNLEVIAEGVETHEQLAFLKGRGCDRFQGYLLAKPTRAEELALGHLLGGEP